MIIKDFLPQGKSCAVIFTIDDLHPAQQAKDGYDAGGDVDKGVFGLVDTLLKKYPALQVTLFATASWREIAPFPQQGLQFSTPAIYDRRYAAPILPKDYFNLTKFPEFVQYYNHHPQVDIGLHGYEHIHKGNKMPIEFQEYDTMESMVAKVQEMYAIFDAAGLHYVNGFTPPAWNIPKRLLKLLQSKGLKFLTSARDLITPITVDAMNHMSGMRDVSIIYPTLVSNNKIVHIPTNFQVTSDYERAFEIAEHHGIISIKAHMVKNLNGFDQIDGVTAAYMEYLDKLLEQLIAKYQDTIWWTTPNIIANKILSAYGNTSQS